MVVMGQLEEAQQGRRQLGLLGLIVGVAASALILDRVAGPPHLPDQLPSQEVVLRTLQGSFLPLDTLAYVLTTAAWFVLLWIVASLGLRLVVGIADALTHGAGWVRRLRVLSDRITLPVVRRGVDGAFVAIMIVNLATRSPASAGAAPLQPATLAIGAGITAPTSAEPGPTGQHAEPGTADYVVQPGDTLWAISERFYGKGEEYPRLVAANAGRVMPDGRRFTRAGVIQPGWVLLIPPSPATDAQRDDDPSYVVEPGDTLRSIAAHVLGDEARWPEIFELNRGTASVNGHVLTQPDLIWPGLLLQLPQSDENRDSDSAPAPAPSTPEPTPELLPPATPFPSVDLPPEPITSPSSSSESEAAAVTSPTPVTGADPSLTSTWPTPEESSNTPLPVPVATPSTVRQPKPAAKGATPSPFIYEAAGLTAAALAGGAALLVRRRVRRSLDAPPIPSPSRLRPVPGSNFAEAELTGALAHRLDGEEVELATAVAERAYRFLSDRGVGEAELLLAFAGQNVVSLIFEVSLAEQSYLSELVAPFGADVGGTARAAVTVEHDVVWRLTGPAAGLLAPLARSEPDEPLLLAIGITSTREVVYANWSALGHVLFVGLPGAGVEVSLTAFVATLAAGRPPRDLRFRMIADRHSLPPQLAELPHREGDVVDPEDDVAIRATLAELQAELLSRMRDDKQDHVPCWESSREQPELVLLAEELANLKDDGTTFELIGRHGPAHGIRLLAATTDLANLGEDMLARFATRLVLQTLDDNDSIRLLGRPGAADLGDGEVFLQLDAREPLRLRGFHVSSEHLDELLRLMCRAYNRECGEIVSSRPVINGPASALWDPEGRGASNSAVPGGLKEQVEISDGDKGDENDLDTPAPQRELTEARQIRLTQETTDDEMNGVEGGIPSSGEARRPVDAAPLPADATPVVPTTIDDTLSLPVHAAADLPDAVHENPDDELLLQVRCLGDFTVMSGHQEIQPVGEEGPSYKAWEVLAFLACRPGMMASKEALFTAVWPDIDEQRAANRLRVTMVRLRGLLLHQVPDLPAGVVRCERDGTCRLDPTLVWSDAQEFLTLCHSGAKLPPQQAKPTLEQARTLYRGDLLAGRGARFYEWVDERDESGISPRERYREEYYRATQRLARLYRSEGRATLAVPLYKDLLKAEPTLEDVVRDLYRCYKELGDLSSLNREDRHLREALRVAYYDPNDPEDDPDEYQPEPETVELFEQVRAELEASAAVRGPKSSRRGRAR